MAFIITPCPLPSTFRSILELNTIFTCPKLGYLNLVVFRASFANLFVLRIFLFPSSIHSSLKPCMVFPLVESNNKAPKAIGRVVIIDEVMACIEEQRTGLPLEKLAGNNLRKVVSVRKLVYHLARMLNTGFNSDSLQTNRKKD